MSATNVTTYYEFPVFVGSDKPAWLVDWNGAMNAIDSAIHEAKTEADANATNIASLQSSVTSLSGSVESQGSSITSLTQSLTSLQGTVNTITSLIGNGEPTTQDKTIIGAINELKADIDAIAPSGDVQADDVSYDNTSSGLTATDVQSAIDEINGKIPQGGSVDADDVTYDNTQSGLTATNVQSAIDELAQGKNAIVAPETKIGTFLGKDLYRKVITATNPSGVIDATLTSSYIDDLVDLHGYAYVSTGNLKLPITWANVTSSTQNTLSVISNSGGLTLQEQGITASSITVIVEYTKA